MFKDSVAFSGFSVDDLAAAKAFYSLTLGLETTAEMGLLRLDLATGGKVIVYPKPNHQPATYTVLNFPVDNIDAAVKDLAAKSIAFERYDGMHQDEHGISRGRAAGQGPDIAWFKDPGGNIVSVLQNQ
ncbi:MAG: VOC family protein [Candidatus Saccharimonadales bacterium]